MNNKKVTITPMVDLDIYQYPDLGIYTTHGIIAH